MIFRGDGLVKSFFLLPLFYFFHIFIYLCCECGDSPFSYFVLGLLFFRLNGYFTSSSRPQMNRRVSHTSGRTDDDIYLPAGVSPMSARLFLYLFFLFFFSSKERKYPIPIVVVYVLLTSLFIESGAFFGFIFLVCCTISKKKKKKKGKSRYKSRTKMCVRI